MTTSADIVPYGTRSHNSILARPRPRRQALDHVGGAYQRYRGQQEPPTAQRRHPNPRWPQAREPWQTLAPLARQRAYLGGDVLVTVCRPRVGSVSLRDPWGRHGWPCRRSWRRGAEAPRRLSGARPAPGVARAPQSHRAWSRGAPHGPGRAAAHGEPHGGHGGLSRRRRVRWAGAAGHTACAGLVLWVPYGHEPASAMGGADLAPRCVRRVSPGGEAAGVTRGLCYPRGVWSDHGAVLWGHGVSSALVSGQQADDRRGGVSLVSKALPHRDLVLRPAKSRRPSASVAYSRPAASFSALHSGVLSLYLDGVLRLVM